jgi:transcriptional regulator with XRE-family HTH domain
MDGTFMSSEAGGEYLVTLRRLANMRQEDVAAAVPATDRTMSRWENGENRPSTRKARKLMKVLRGSLDSFLELWEDAKATRADAVSRAVADR